MSRGGFISFEGGDGVGKSTQIRLLASRLTAAGAETIITREPGGSPGAEEVRRLLVEGAPEKWSALSEALLMYAARRDHVERIIEPGIEKGAFVLSDRFADSTMAYQGLAGDLGEDIVRDLQRIVLDGLNTDLTIILDLPAAESLERTTERSPEEARFEQKGLKFQAAVRQAFLEIAKREPERCVVIDATGGMEDVAEAIWKEVSARWPALATA